MAALMGKVAIVTGASRGTGDRRMLSSKWSKQPSPLDYRTKHSHHWWIGLRRTMTIVR
jgi:hypothetical protein